jgi:hypothetical protein
VVRLHRKSSQLGHTLHIDPFLRLLRLECLVDLRCHTATQKDSLMNRRCVKCHHLAPDQEYLRINPDMWPSLRKCPNCGLLATTGSFPFYGLPRPWSVSRILNILSGREPMTAVDVNRELEGDNFTLQRVRQVLYKAARSGHINGDWRNPETYSEKLG